MELAIRKGERRAEGDGRGVLVEAAGRVRWVARRGEADLGRLRAKGRGDGSGVRHGVSVLHTRAHLRKR